MRVRWKNDRSWFSTAVYGAPRFSRRQQLWSDLVEVSHAVSGAWAVIGDFNSSISLHERRVGGVVQPHKDSYKFRSTMQECELIDAGFQGHPFTWKKGSMEGRIDICLINIGWRLRFQEAYVQLLSLLKSDHRPLLLCLDWETRWNLRRRPFRFEASSIMHSDFPEFIRSHWDSNDCVWNDRLFQLQSDLRKWNKEVFGCIKSRKKMLIRRLEWLDNQRQSQRYVGIDEEYSRVWKEYETDLDQEDIFWFQKSRSRWLHHGDQNTLYFHGVTTIRRRKNRYDTMQNDQGTWINNQMEIEKMVVGYYREI